MKKAVYIGLGSNLGHKVKNLQKAVDEIEAVNGINIKKLSSLYSSKAWGNTEQADFVNQIIKIETEIPPMELLGILQDIEIKMGRQRKEKWGPRVIDLDIVLYGNEILDSLELKIPHPYIRERLFVLVPLQEINPEFIFPDDGAKIKEVLVRVLAQNKANQIQKMHL
jgi:2-amino-4-hydroxy-6-hydroxymethyldihydropteridine diphosphokinase